MASHLCSNRNGTSCVLPWQRRGARRGGPLPALRATFPKGEGYPERPFGLPFWGRWIAAKRQDGRGPCGWVSRLCFDRNGTSCVLPWQRRGEQCQGTSSVWPSASQLPQRGSLLDAFHTLTVDDIAPKGKAWMASLSSAFPSGEGAPGGGGRGPCGWLRAFVATGMKHSAFCQDRGAGSSARGPLQSGLRPASFPRGEAFWMHSIP